MLTSFSISFKHKALCIFDALSEVVLTAAEHAQSAISSLPKLLWFVAPAAKGHNLCQRYVRIFTLMTSVDLLMLLQLKYSASVLRA